MNEHVFAAVNWSDESKSFCGVEPLYRSLHAFLLRPVPEDRCETDTPGPIHISTTSISYERRAVAPN